MKQHADQFGLAAMCRMLGVHRSGYYAWLKEPASDRDRDDQRLLGLIKHSWLESGSVYGHRKVTTDLRELGETCSRHRVARLMKSEGLRAMVGYGRRPRPLSGPVGSVAKTVLARGCKVSEPNRAWVTDITYIRTYDGFLYLAVVLDLFFAPSRWMGNPANSAYGFGSAGAVGCSVAAQASPRTSASLRPRHAVHQ